MERLISLSQRILRFICICMFSICIFNTHIYDIYYIIYIICVYVKVYLFLRVLCCHCFIFGSIWWLNILPYVCCARILQQNYSPSIFDGIHVTVPVPFIWIQNEKQGVPFIFLHLLGSTSSHYSWLLFSFFYVCVCLFACFFFSFFLTSTSTWKTFKDTQKSEIFWV